MRLSLIRRFSGRIDSLLILQNAASDAAHALAGILRVLIALPIVLRYNWAMRLHSQKVIGGSGRE